MKRIPKLNMTHEDWLRIRQTMIGGSDVPALLGISKYKTPLQLYMEKIAEQPVELEDSDRLWFGKELEPVIARRWSLERDLPTENVNAILQHDTLPYMGADVDRRIVGTGGNPGILEIKTTNPYTYKQWADHGVALDHMAQIQHYLYITGYTWGSFAILVGGQQFHTLDVQRNDQLIDMIASRITRFWNDYVLPRIPPPAISTADTAALYPVAEKKKTMIVVPEMYEFVRRIREIKTQQKKLDDEYETLSVEIQNHMQDTEILEQDGEKVVSWAGRAGYKRFDSKKFSNDHPDLYEQYKTQEVKSSRTFTVTPLADKEDVNE